MIRTEPARLSQRRHRGLPIVTARRQAHEMHGLSTDSRATRDDWCGDNDRGLSYAAEGAWADAADAFSAAADVVALHSDVASHEALALVLNNLAQACFRDGRTDDAIRHGQRACTLRAALFGDDAISVVRARADLAVMLGSVGRIREGLGLMGRAIGGFERTVGDEDLRLASLLENAARLALTAGEPSTAEPFLIRLHALLAAHDQPTAAADSLLARISRFRNGHAVAASAPVIASSVNARTPMVDEPGDATRLLDIDLAAFAPIESSEPEDIFGNTMLDLVELPAVSEDETHAASPPASECPPDILGFVVEYGTPDESLAPPLVETAAPVPQPSTRVPTPLLVTPLSSQPETSHPRDERNAVAVPPASDLESDRRLKRPNIRAGRASAPRSSQGLLIAGVVTTTIAAAAVWLLR